MFPELELTEQNGFAAKTDPNDTVKESLLRDVGPTRLYDAAVTNLPLKVTLGAFPRLGVNEGVKTLKSLQV